MLPDKQQPPHTSEKPLEEDHRSLQTLNTILSATSEYVYMFDKQGRFSFASERGAAVHGMTQSEMTGKSWQELGMSAEYMEPFEVHIQKVMETGQAVIEEVPFPVVTAHVSAADQKRALAVGCTVHRGKPFKTGVLLKCIADLLTSE